MNLGLAIKTVRKQLGVTQGQLSKKTAISQTSLSKIEGGTTPSQKNLNKICKALDVPPSVIYMLAMEHADIPTGKRKIYDLLFPSIKNLALQIVGEKAKKFISEE
jgi:XRE family transcriptional regulator, regulator of sulfur utilization